MLFPSLRDRHTMTLPVLIIGAGLGGICLAQPLHRITSHTSYSSKTKEATSEPRATGFESPKTASTLYKKHLPQNSSLYSTCADTAKMGVRIKPDGSPAPSKPGHGPPPYAMSGSVYTVDRSTFRQTLLASLEGHVFFGKSLTHYKIHDDKVRVPGHAPREPSSRHEPGDRSRRCIPANLHVRMYSFPSCR